VYRLQVARDFGRLPQVVDQIRQWHSTALSLESAGPRTTAL
jgi:hypothetical protein